MQFEWDEQDASRNPRKLRVFLLEAATAIQYPLAVTVPDLDHSVGEDRILTMGLFDQDRLLVVSYTAPGSWIRIISAIAAAMRP